MGCRRRPVRNISFVKGVDAVSNNLEAAAVANKPNIMIRVIDKITDLADSVMGLAMVFTALITLYEVIVRHFLKSPTIWTYDVSIYLLIWYSFMVAGKALKDDHHIKVDILITNLRGRARVAADTLGLLGVAVYSGLMSFYTFRLCHESLAFKERTISLLRMPVWLIQLGMVIGSILLFLQAVILFSGKIKEWSKLGFAPGKGLRENPYFVLITFFILLVLGLSFFNISRGAAVIITVFALLLVGVPVFAGLGLMGCIGLFYMMGLQSGLPQIAVIAQKGVESYTLLAIPLFILAGNFLVEGGIGQELYDVCVKWIGHLPGGIAVATIAACAIFAAISGSSVATAAIIGMVALPELRKYEYDPVMSYGLLAAGGTLGILIPPSSSMIVYATITEESTGALFMGGVIPGLIMATIFAAYAVIFCMRTGKYLKMERCSREVRLKTTLTSIWGILTPVIILTSIYTGFCTPTEAAGVAVAYAMLVSLFRRKIKVTEILKIAKMGNGSGGMIMMIVAGALIMGNVITIMQVPQQIINYVGTLSIPPGVVLFVLCLIFIVLGMFLEVISIMYIAMPIVYPLVVSLGYNGIWFGVFATLLMEMALITPPVGLNTFVIQGIAKAPMSQVIRGVLPFMLLLGVGLVILYLFPFLATWLPSTMGYGGF